MTDTTRLHWYSLKRVPAWEYGYIGSGAIARRHVKSGKVEFRTTRGGYCDVPLTEIWLEPDRSWNETFEPLPVQPGGRIDINR